VFDLLLSPLILAEETVMGEETSRILPKVFFPVAIFCALLISGCPKTQETASPATEARKAPAEIARPGQAPPPPAAAQRAAERSAAAQPAAPQPAEKPRPPAPESNQQVVLSGEALLDPSVPSDAKLIQGRLAELGLYRGAIDGAWGRNSRAALRAFKEKNSLGDPEAWDRDTQILLFRETGK